jgi:hypothetical protein
VRAGLIACVVASGCARDPSVTCPLVAAGDVVVTEVMGDADATSGQWIELFNATDEAIELEGLRVRFRKKDGSGEVPVLVRRSLVIAPGEYATLGRYPDDARPAHIAYGFGGDFEDKWLGAAAIDVESCGERIDLAQYDALPAVGTFAFGASPDADINDIPSEWCFDSAALGTPGAANPPCPVI